MALVGAPFQTARDTMAQLAIQSNELSALGLPEFAVYQADTAESPESKPFIVLRWGDTQDGLGGSWARTLTWWFYDKLGDYNRASNMAKTVQSWGGRNFDPIATANGWVTQFRTEGAGLGIGGDLADDGFDALVVPMTTVVVGRGD